jgi:hypothetical protein
MHSDLVVLDNVTYSKSKQSDVNLYSSKASVQTKVPRNKIR